MPKPTACIAKNAQQIASQDILKNIYRIYVDAYCKIEGVARPDMYCSNSIKSANFEPLYQTTNCLP